jgi:hypothetical protein
VGLIHKESHIKLFVLIEFYFFIHRMCRPPLRLDRSSIFAIVRNCHNCHWDAKEPLDWNSMPLITYPYYLLQAQHFLDKSTTFYDVETSGSLCTSVVCCII